MLEALRTVSRCRGAAGRAPSPPTWRGAERAARRSDQDGREVRDACGERHPWNGRHVLSLCLRQAPRLSRAGRPRPRTLSSASACRTSSWLSCAACPAIRHLIRKGAARGGITSNDTLSKGLGLRIARVLARVRAGCSLVRCLDDRPRFAKLPVATFPGNVGGDEALMESHAGLTAARGAL